MEFKDYYKTLGVDRAAEQKAVSTAFRKLARKYHPDINKTKGAEDTFKEINEAYQVLGDPEKRAKYDQMHEAYQRGGVNWQDMFGRPGAWQSKSPGGWTVTMEGNPADLEDLFGGLGGFSDFFRQFFGGDVAGPQPLRERTRRRPRQAVEEPFGSTVPAQAEVAAPLEVTLEDAHTGAQKSVTLQVNGTTRGLDVTIPKGIRSGQRIRLPGALDGRDLFLTIQIAPHSRFERREDDLVVEVPVSLTEALLGGKIEVPTLDGTVEMTIPPETQNGQLFRLRGQGISRRDGARGDLIVRVHAVLPKNLTTRERELVEELDKLRRENPRT